MATDLLPQTLLAATPFSWFTDSGRAFEISVLTIAGIAALLEWAWRDRPEPVETSEVAALSWKERRRQNRIHRMRFGFAMHLIAFLCVNSLLLFINLATSPNVLWFYWPLMGWGIGLLSHAAATFLLPGASWECGDARQREVAWRR